MQNSEDLREFPLALPRGLEFTNPIGFEIPGESVLTVGLGSGLGLILTLALTLIIDPIRGGYVPYNQNIRYINIFFST